MGCGRQTHANVGFQPGNDVEGGENARRHVDIRYIQMLEAMF